MMVLAGTVGTLGTVVFGGAAAGVHTLCVKTMKTMPSCTDVPGVPMFRGKN